MNFTPLKGIENLDIETANRIGIQVEYGTKEGIWIYKDIKDQIVTSIDQNTLKINLSKSGEHGNSLSFNNLIVIVRKISKVNCSSYFTTQQEREYSPGQISISGFQQGNLDLQISRGVTVYLGASKLNTLNANIGTKKDGGAALNISSDTKIDNASFTIPGSSTLGLAAPNITKVTYNLSDSATVTLSGKLVQMIK